MKPHDDETPLAKFKNFVYSGRVDIFYITFKECTILIKVPFCDDTFFLLFWILGKLHF